MNKHWIATCIAAACVALGSTATAGVLDPPPVQRRAERPASQVGQPFSTSMITRTVNLPAGANTVSFDFGVDSEQWDFLRLYVNGQQLWSISGRNRLGNRRINICSSGGSCMISFVYQKNGSLNHGRDTAWVDNVLISSSAVGRVETHRFDSLVSGPPADWQGAGYGGGFQLAPYDEALSASRPARHSFLGDTGQTTVSYMERSIYWGYANDNTLSFSYFVDSEEGGDFLRVRIDSAVVFEASGLNVQGYQQIPVSQGSHMVRFEYEKNGSVDAGLDTARVADIVARTGGSTIYEAHTFAGRPLGRAPQAPGVSTPEWIAGGEGRGWVVSRQLPERAYVPRQTVGQSLGTGFQVFTEPVVDGSVVGDYKNSTDLALTNYLDASEPGLLRMVTSNSGSLFTGMRVPGSSSIAGSETGTVTVWLDSRRFHSLATAACKQGVPGPEDRRLTIDYEIEPGQSVASVWVTQVLADCSGNYFPAEPAQQWPVTVAISEPPTDLGYLHIEVKTEIDPASDAFSSDKLGFAILYETSYGTPALIRFPYHDDGVGPLDHDVLTWETLNLATHAGRTPEFSERRAAARCCYPEVVTQP